MDPARTSERGSSTGGSSARRPSSLLVADGSSREPGQVTVEEFLGAARAAAIEVANRELAALGRSAEDCPYIERYITYYRGQTPEHVESVARAYAGGDFGDAEALLGAVTARAQQAVVNWIRSGALEPLPAGAPTPVMTGPDPSSAILAHGGPRPAGVDPRWVQLNLGRGEALQGGVRTRMERAFGADFSDVRLHADSRGTKLTRGFGLHGFALGNDIAIAEPGLRPGHLAGDALLAHELAHVVQQRSSGPGAGEARLERQADEAAFQALAFDPSKETTGAAAEGLSRGGLRLQGCSDCSGGRSRTRVPFSTVSTQVRAASDAAGRTAALDPGLQSATAWADELRTLTGSGQGPVPAIRARVTRETGVGSSSGSYPTLDANPLYGVPNSRILQAYRAWAENPTNSEPPWVLLAIWVKEGMTATPVPNEISASSVSDARAIWRSRTYYQNLGADHYTHYTATPGADNSIDTSPGTGAAHDTAFRAAITAQVAAGRLPRDISTEIDRALAVTAVSGSPGRYNVVASSRFYELSLMLVDAYWRENRAALESSSVVTGMAPSEQDLRGLTYMRWNTGALGGFLGRDMSGNADADASVPSLPVWAFHREVRPTEYGEPRSNAVRFLYAVEVYRLVYEGFTP